MKRYAMAALFMAVMVLIACEVPGGAFDDAIPLTVGVGYADTIVGKDTSIAYRFVAAGNGSHTIALTNIISDVSWELYDADHALLQECDKEWDDNEIDVTPALSGGATYFVVVFEYDDVTEEYTVTVTFP